ncbi:C4-dicarboxylate TRAP transporter substrate-binding protein [Oscillibacter sp.]|uniref:C4-dicarboxylate TRAP transporter substrate-binding protein n=1 Tax=Oscillibacter sp. TaxID=1945593 RepID=UPI0028AD59EC|nr:C4-dicarboxylate TRAP transporter substrate-binding protein [Oscillibacter sp.]
MRKIFAAILVSVMLTGLAACGSSTSSSGASNGSEKDANASTSSAPVVIQIAYENNPGEPIDLGCNEWARLIQERSNGTMTVELFPSSQMGTKTDLVDQMQMGQGIITIGDAAFWADYGAKEMGIASAPYIYDSWDQYFNLLKTDWWQTQVDQLVDNGLRIVSANWAYGVRELMTTKPVRTLDDLSGMIIRTPNNMMQMKTWEEMGAAPTAMALGDVYTATQQGTIDGMENPMATLYGQTYYEVAKYITMIDYIRMPIQWITSEDWFESLTEEQRQILCETGDEAGLFHNQKQDEMSAQYVSDMEANGVEIITPEAAEMARFKEAALQIYSNPDVTANWSDGLYDNIRSMIS